MIRALLVDLDGTLAETEELHREAFNRVFQERGLPLHWDQDTYARLLRITGGKERIARALEACPDCPRLDAGTVAEVHRRKTEVYQSLLWEKEVALRPGVVRVLTEAKEAGLTLALCTTTDPKGAATFLEAAGLSPFFDLVLAGDAVPRKKPYPAIFLLARELLGLQGPEGIVLEDSEPGLQAGVGAGFPVVVTPSFYTRDHNFRRATALLPHLGEPGRPAPVLQGPRQGEKVVVDRLYLEEVAAWWSV